MGHDIDKKIYELVAAIAKDGAEWKKYVDDCGNECAYTDTLLETIAKNADLLGELHESRFE